MKTTQLEIAGKFMYAVSIAPYDTRLPEIRSIKGRKWLPEKKVWTIPITSESTKVLEELVKRPVPRQFSKYPKSATKVKSPNPAQVLAPLSEERNEKIEQFKHYLRSKRFSESTVKTYSDALRVFLRYFAEKSLADIDNNDVIDFNVNYILANHYSATYQNQVVHPVGLKKY